MLQNFGLPAYVATRQKLRLNYQHLSAILSLGIIPTVIDIK